jgi:2-polyprenyl-6-methoxyphenol hydroxylase-like FAD-dependent oxidoreductase
MRTIINGAGIAGPTLAYWLRKAGHEVVLVEAAPQLRTGGYVIDFGLVGYDIAEKMGLALLLASVQSTSARKPKSRAC